MLSGAGDGNDLCAKLLFSIYTGMKVCDVDEDNSLLSMTTSQDGIPPPDPLRVDWPKVIYARLIHTCVGFCHGKRLTHGIIFVSGPCVDQPPGQFVHPRADRSVALGPALRV